MADGITTLDFMVSANEVPWHKKGLVTDGYIKSADINRLARLDGWDVQKVQIPLPGESGVFWDSHVFLVRQDTGQVLSIVGKGYEIQQNEDCPTLLDYLTDSGDLEYVTAGSLFACTRTWWLTRIPERIIINGDEQESIQLYMLLTNSFDMSWPVGFYITPVRVVCNNTASVAISTAKRSHTLRHTKNMQFRLDEARQALGITLKYGDVFKQVAEILAGTEMNDSQQEATLDAIPDFALKVGDEEKKGKGLTQARNNRDKFRKILTETPDLGSIKGTAWGFFQAATTMNDHYTTFRGKSGVSEEERVEVQADNRFANVFGLNSAPTLTQRVYGVLNEKYIKGKLAGVK